MANVDMETFDRELSASPPPAPQTTEPINFAPIAERAPELTGKAIRAAYDSAAKAVEDAAQTLLTAVEEVMAVAKMTADSTRAVGESKAQVVEAALGQMRDMSRSLREHHNKLREFNQHRQGTA